jgi:cellulose synthase/poly-beta-1,6-N-acetylglucosamine synthase-like glycosyltransferase
MSFDQVDSRGAGQPETSSTAADPTAVRAIELSIDGLSDAHPGFSARRQFTRRQLVGAVAFLCLNLVGLWSRPLLTGTIWMGAMTTAYIGVLAMRIDLMARRGANQRFAFDDDELAALDPGALPTFTILVPAYKEPDVLSRLVGNLAALVYPKDKLEIKLLLEEDDAETRAAAAAMDLQHPFEVVVVPPIGPRTKPKALNFALVESTGDIVCIYDAEDHPDPMQLMKVAATFEQVGPDVACVQAELSYFNADENIITRWFAVEYRAWFTQFLPSLARVDAAIPLGGTSNHFRRELLVALGAWDPYNVTEDADLGIRLRRQGFRVAVLESATEEEANTDFVNWIKQRSRWYKGYAQTWLVHMRHPLTLVRELGVIGFLRFNLFVGGTPLIALLNPVAWSLLVMWFTLEPVFIRQMMPGPIYYFGLFGWLIGNFTFYYLNLAVAYEFEERRVFRAALLLPVYWVMMSIAATKAFVQLVFTPNYWEKTQHGLSRQSAARDGVGSPAVANPV